MNELTKLKDIEKKPGDGVSGFTTLEAADHWGLGQVAARERIKNHIRNGSIEYAGKAPRVGIDGKIQHVPVYKVVGND